MFSCKEGDGYRVKLKDPRKLECGVRLHGIKTRSYMVYPLQLYRNFVDFRSRAYARDSGQAVHSAALLTLHFSKEDLLFLEPVAYGSSSPYDGVLLCKHAAALHRRVIVHETIIFV